MGDLRQLFMLLQDFDPDNLSKPVKDKLTELESDLQKRAEKYMQEGKYEDAERILNRMTAQPGDDDSKMPLVQPGETCSRIVTLYEKMGDFAAAEAYQELIIRKYCDWWEDCYLEEVDRLNRFYTLFYHRIKGLHFATYSRMVDLARTTVLRRVAVLDRSDLAQTTVPYEVAILKDSKVINAFMQNHEIGLPRFPLHVAARIGTPRMIRTILDRNVCNIDDQDDNGRTAMHLTIEPPRTELLGLLKAGAFLEARCHEGKTVLHYAADFGPTVFLRMLLDYGASVEATDTEGLTALHYAAKSDSVEKVSRLLDKGANTESKCLKGTTPLHHAARAEMEEAVRLLLEGGAIVDAKDCRGRTALLEAVEHNRTPSIVQQLLCAGAEVNVNDEVGMTPLLIAVKTGSLDITKLLIDNGADLAATNQDRSTALHLALPSYKILREATRQAIVETLLQAGADVNAQAECKLTPLHLEVTLGGYNEENGNEQILDLLLRYGAFIQARTHTGCTPLHIAISWRNPSTIRFLLGAQSVDEARKNWYLENSEWKSPEQLFNDLLLTLEDGQDVKVWHELRDFISDIMDPPVLLSLTDF